MVEASDFLGDERLRAEDEPLVRVGQQPAQHALERRPRSAAAFGATAERLGLEHVHHVAQRGHCPLAKDHRPDRASQRVAERLELGRRLGARPAGAAILRAEEGGEQVHLRAARAERNGAQPADGVGGRVDLCCRACQGSAQLVAAGRVPAPPVVGARLAQDGGALVVARRARLELARPRAHAQAERAECDVGRRRALCIGLGARPPCRAAQLRRKRAERPADLQVAHGAQHAAPNDVELRHRLRGALPVRVGRDAINARVERTQRRHHRVVLRVLGGGRRRLERVEGGGGGGARVMQRLLLLIEGVLERGLVLQPAKLGLMLREQRRTVAPHFGAPLRLALERRPRVRHVGCEPLTAPLLRPEPIERARVGDGAALGDLEFSLNRQLLQSPWSAHRRDPRRLRACGAHGEQLPAARVAREYADESRLIVGGGILAAISLRIRMRPRLEPSQRRLLPNAQRSGVEELARRHLVAVLFTRGTQGGFATWRLAGPQSLAAPGASGLNSAWPRVDPQDLSATQRAVGTVCLTVGHPAAARMRWSRTLGAWLCLSWLLGEAQALLPLALSLCQAIPQALVRLSAPPQLQLSNRAVQRSSHRAGGECRMCSADSTKRKAQPAQESRQHARAHPRPLGPPPEQHPLRLLSCVTPAAGSGHRPWDRIVVGARCAHILRQTACRRMRHRPGHAL